MTDQAKLTEIGMREILNHTEEANRLKEMAELLITSSEWHIKQADRWHEYLGNLSMPEQREKPILTLIEGEG